MLTPEDWIEKGYRRFNEVKHMTNADFGLQKCIRDDKGKKYYITVYVYDNSKYNHIDCFKRNPWSFAPDCQFCGPLLTTNIELILSETSTIEDVEKHMESLWIHTGSVYYDTY